MRFVRLKGANPGFARELRDTDFESLGIENQEGVVWNEENNHTVELKNATADALIAKLGDEFEIGDDSTPDDDDMIGVN